MYVLKENNSSSIISSMSPSSQAEIENKPLLVICLLLICLRVFAEWQRLMLSILEAFLNKDENGFSGEELDEMWKDELNWIEKLIKLYVGREALWLHRRFLSSCWIKHFASTNHRKPRHSSKKSSGTCDIDRFIDNELQLFNSCATIIDCHFDDYQAQATYAATYIMWLKKQIQVESLGIEFQRKLQLSGLKTLLNNACPEKAFLWDSLLQLCGSE
nr:protein prenyltransferase alpha subunit repeat-containing protein 1-like [Ipomoea batatas]GMC56700.1 protein prenyltransferase alpha subunit repeat-containing protein 1-like [Ipomoea batatas]